MVGREYSWREVLVDILAVVSVVIFLVLVQVWVGERAELRAQPFPLHPETRFSVLQGGTRCTEFSSHYYLQSSTRDGYLGGG